MMKIAGQMRVIYGRYGHVEGKVRAFASLTSAVSSQKTFMTNVNFGGSEIQVRGAINWKLGKV